MTDARSRSRNNLYSLGNAMKRFLRVDDDRADICSMVHRRDTDHQAAGRCVFGGFFLNLSLYNVYCDTDLARTIKDRNVSLHLTQNNDAWRRHASITVIDDEVARTP